MADNSSQVYSPSGYYDIGSPSNRVGNVYAAASAVSQSSSITTAVTLNATSGVITTQATSLAAGANAQFTLNNDKITANSAVDVNICNFAGTWTTNGLPAVAVQGVTAGSCTVVVYNAHSANATGANAVKISFNVVG